VRGWLERSGLVGRRDVTGVCRGGPAPLSPVPVPRGASVPSARDRSVPPLPARGRFCPSPSSRSVRKPGASAVVLQIPRTTEHGSSHGTVQRPRNTVAAMAPYREEKLHLRLPVSRRTLGYVWHVNQWRSRD
jgi:hypothetical protein